nr:response regulator transcription factor [Bacteroidota bacterium]
MDIVVIGKNQSINKALCEMLKDEMGMNTHIVSSSKVFDDKDYRLMCTAAIIIVDLDSVETNSRVLISEIHELFPDVKIIALHIYTSKVLIDPIIAAGASAYLLIDTSRKELVMAVQKITNGEKFISYEVG